MKHSNIIQNRKEHFLKNLEFHYDTVNDLLYVFKKDASVYSTIVVGEFHVECSKNSEIVGIEVLRASEILSEYGISQHDLEHIHKAEIKSVVRNNSLLVSLILHSLNQEKSAVITLTSLDAVQALSAV